MSDSSATLPLDQDDARALPALKKAWRYYRELRSAARHAERRYQFLRMAFVGAVFLALTLAILTRQAGNGDLEQAAANPFVAVVRLFIPILLTFSLLFLAYANRAGEHEVWWLLRSAAAEVKRHIYVFATILQDQENREQWLHERVSAVRRRSLDSLGRDLPEAGDDDEADRQLLTFHRLLAEDYLQQRIDRNIAAQTEQAKRLRTWQTGLMLLVLAVLGAASISTAGAVSRLHIGADLWVVLGPAFALSILTWTELVRLSSEVDRSREVAIALGQIQDHWYALAPIERTAARFFRLVQVAERVLWNRYDDAVPAIRRTLARLQEGGDDLLEQVLKAPPAITLDEALQKQAEYGEVLAQKKIAQESGMAPAYVPPTRSQELARIRRQEAEPPAPRVVKGGRPHAFVVMPFGRKQGTGGHWIDFDEIYARLIKPALEEAGLEAFRADEESVSGDILTDMFQELLLADVVIADLSIDNANVYYELGVRHAMRKRGLVHIQSGRSHMPFDIFNVRTLPYHCDASGRPEAKLLEKDRLAIVKAARETWASDRDLVHSPIYNLLSGLPEPDRQALSTPLATGYWREYNEWKERIDIARRQNRIGDLLILTEEVSNPLIKESAIVDAGRALRALGLHELALQQYRRGLELNPRHVEFRREEAVHLSRLKRSDEAIVKLNRVLQDHPGDINCLFNLGEFYEDLWLDEVSRIDDKEKRLVEAYESSHWLKQAIDTLLQAYRLDQNHPWVAVKLLVNAVLLDHVARLAGVDNDPEAEAVRAQLPALTGAVRFTVESRSRSTAPSYSELIVQGYLALCTVDDVRAVVRAFKKAVTLARKNRYYLVVALKNLQRWQAVEFRPQHIAAALAMLEEALARLDEESAVSDAPPQVFLFAGDDLDHPGAATRRFVPEMEDEAVKHIEAVLDRSQASPQCLAITSGASAGSDILFIEACLRRQMQVDVYLAFDEARYIQEAVSYAEGSWVERFYELRNRPEVAVHRQPDRIGALPVGEDAYERNNRWALYSSLMYGIDRMRLIVLWDGKGTGESTDTADMVRQVRSLGGVVEHINTSDFSYWQAKGKVAKALDQLVEGL